MLPETPGSVLKKYWAQLKAGKLKVKQGEFRHFVDLRRQISEQ